MRFGLGLAAAIGFAFSGIAFAQAPATPVRLSLAYDGRLYIKVLDIHFDEEATPTSFGADASLRSYGLLALFNRFNVRATSRGRIEDGSPRPGVFLYDNRDGERDRKVQVAWRADTVIARSSPAYGNLGQPPASQSQKLTSADPLTQLMRITLSPTPTQVCVGSPRFFDGKQLYALEFENAEPTDLSAEQRSLGLTSAVRCAVTYREIAGFKVRPSTKRGNGLKSRISATFGQIGADGPWVIVMVKADTALGPAIIELKHVETSKELHLATD